MQDNSLLVKSIGLLFVAWFLYGILPYVMTVLGLAVVIFIIARIQKK